MTEQEKKQLRFDRDEAQQSAARYAKEAQVLKNELQQLGTIEQYAKKIFEEKYGSYDILMAKCRRIAEERIKSKKQRLDEMESNKVYQEKVAKEKSNKLLGR